MNKKKASKSEIEQEIRKHVAAEEKAYRWVEHVAIVDSISKSDVNKMINEIMITHYKDMAEERAISKICGYPICSNKLMKKLGNQQYHISTKLNRVFDMSERKLFCSPFCFQASKYLEQQIPDSPLWLRNDSSQKGIDFFSEGMKVSFSACESDVLIGIGNIKLEDINDPMCGECCEEDERSDVWDKSEIEPKNTVKSKSDSNVVKKSKLIQPSIAVDHWRDNLEEKLETLKNLLKEWFTEESYKFVQSLKPNVRNEISHLNSDTTQFAKKANEFLSASRVWKKSNGDVRVSSDANESLSQKPPLLPTVDSHSQKAIRRRVVKERIHRSLDKLTKVSGLLHSDYTFHAFYKLIDTFRFTSKNIILHPNEWLVMSVLLLEILASYEKLIEETLSSEAENLNDFLIKQELCDMQAISDVVKEFKSEVLFEHDEKDDGDENVEENSLEYIHDMLEYIEELD